MAIPLNKSFAFASSQGLAIHYAYPATETFIMYVLREISAVCKSPGGSRAKELYMMSETCGHKKDSWMPLLFKNSLKRSSLVSF